MKYFVYDLVDPRTGKTFYVGKGQGDRPYGHFREAESGVVSEKCSRIVDIWASGMEPRIRCVRRFREEIDAYKFEKLRIARFGLHNLTNVRPGGGSPRAPREPWGKEEFEQYAQRLAIFGLSMAHGGRILAKADGKTDLTRLWRAILANFIAKLGVTYVRQRLIRENIHILGGQFVQIAPEVIAKIRMRRAPIQLSLFTLSDLPT